MVTTQDAELLDQIAMNMTYIQTALKELHSNVWQGLKT